MTGEPSSKVMGRTEAVTVSATAEEPGDAADARAHIVIMQVGLNGEGVDPDLRDAISERLAQHPLLTADAAGARSRCLPSLMLDLTATLDRSNGRVAEIDLRWLVSNSHGRMIGLIEQRARLETDRRDSDAALWQLGLDSVLDATPSKLVALRGAEPAPACTVAAHIRR